MVFLAKVSFVIKVIMLFCKNLMNETQVVLFKFCFVLRDKIFSWLLQYKISYFYVFKIGDRKLRC